MQSSASLVLANDHLRVEIARLGAEMVSLRHCDGRDFLWRGDAAVWSGRAPLLFPVVGRLAQDRLRLGAQHFSMAQHGFARRSVFTVESSAPTHCALTLAADEATGAQFPFRFLMRAAYALEGARLTLRVTIENHDARAMPFSFGFHPALRWPLPGAANRAGHMILFERDEPRDIHILEDGYLGPARKSPAQGRAIALRDDLFAQSALVFTELASSRLRYIGPQGQSVAVGFAGMPHLGLWTKPGADFLCIEPWQGYADRADFSGDFHDKPGVVALAPGASRAFAMTLDLEERGGAFIPPV